MTGLRRVFVASLAVLFVFCISSATVAKDTEYSLKGQVVSVDPLAHQLIVLSVEKVPALTSGTLGEFTFSMDAMTKVTMCNQEKSVGDITGGQEITVSYHERGGKLYADSIDMRAPIMACSLK